ncbi:MAG TPA: sigma-70 family RNA polymerase sigma factor [Ignavibacteria bacterium]|nr:sigma-70 family RNA polymerase sigma factor [Ignavibacteria bacterium]
MDFEEIYNSYNQKIFRLCMSYSNDRDLAKDLTQETFIQVWMNLAKFRNESSIGTWIFRIASNICLRQIERSKKNITAVLPFQIEEITEESNDAKIAFLYKCINGLPETDRLIISLVLEEQPQKDIADILGISEGNVRVKIHRIKQLLTQKFNENEKL